MNVEKNQTSEVHNSKLPRIDNFEAQNWCEIFSENGFNPIQHDLFANLFNMRGVHMAFMP